MSFTHMLMALFFTLYVGLADGASHLGYCPDGSSSDCKWLDYLKDVLIMGLSGWVIAVLVMIIFVAYICSLIVCCCGCGCGEQSQKQTGQQLFVYYIIRVFAWVALLIAGGGVAVAMVGWFKIDDGWNSAWDDITGFTASLLNLGLSLETQLQDVQLKLQTSATILSMPELNKVVTVDAIASTTSFSSDVNKFIKDAHDLANLSYLIARWAFIGFFAVVVLVAFFFALFSCCYKILRHSSNWLIIIGIFATFLMWLIVGVIVVGNRLLSDTCDDITESIGDPNKGTGLLSKLKCDRNANSFTAAYNVYTAGVNSLNQSFCTAVGNNCKGRNNTYILSSCTCRTDGDTERFLRETYVYGDSTCYSNCTVTSCVSRCYQAQQHNISFALARISAARTSLLSNQSAVGTLQNCQYFVQELFRPVESLCGTFKTGLWLLIAGQIVLGAAGLLCIICLIIVECWLRSYSPVVVPNNQKSARSWA
eukprot:GGOE01047361.1.p1 GENE.GGOE01047361.1~~GGOE01047361.1.p1  ORF type:complete len:479 (-),score=127.96 GGOE01047361.1:282-1718(-)